MTLVSASTVSLGWNNINQVDAVAFIEEKHVLNLSAMVKNGWFNNLPEYMINPPLVRAEGSKIVQKSGTKRVRAVNLDGKLLVIKGFTDENTNDPEREVSIEQLTALNTLGQGGSGTSTSSVDGDIVVTEVLIDVPPLNEPISLEDDGEIEEYTIVPGDTIGSIAEKFKISVDTILWANNLSRNSTIRIGQKLTILPISGVAYTIRSGDTVSGIATKFKISQAELVEFNDIKDGQLVIGQILIIPGGTLPSTVSTPSGPKTPARSGGRDAGTGYFTRPIVGGIRSQGLHGHNGIDIAAPIGTPILAARGGRVTLVRGGSGWNGGYGNYIVITHENGIQTLYAHLNSISVSQGDMVKQGEQIGSSGNTGRSTGPHLHFEVRGAKNPF